jgi:ATP-binding cassette subfamily B protein
MTCDKILVLDGGSQAGFGAHAELLENCPVYRDIYMSQIGKDEENGKNGKENIT